MGGSEPNSRDSIQPVAHLAVSLGAKRVPRSLNEICGKILIIASESEQYRVLKGFLCNSCGTVLFGHAET
jgi:hypothetical protein